MIQLMSECNPDGKPRFKRATCVQGNNKGRQVRSSFSGDLVWVDDGKAIQLNGDVLNSTWQVE